MDLSMSRWSDAGVFGAAARTRAEGGDRAEAPSDPAAPRVVHIAVIALFVVPVLASLWAVARSSWIPVSDFAVLEAHVRDVGTSNNPLTGPFSRLGFDHPGPVLAHVLAVPYRLLGDDPRGMLVGAVLVNAAAVAYVGWAALRRGMRFALWTGLLVNLLLWSQAHTSGALLSPWNPYVALLPFLAFTFACWQLSEGGRTAVLAVVIAGSWTVQCHVGYLPLVVPMAAYGGAMGWRLGVLRSRSGRRSAVVGGAAAMVLWLPVAVDQFVGSGNAADILRWSVRPSRGGERIGLDVAARLAGRQLWPHSSWSGAGSGAETFTGGLVAYERWELVVPVVALAAAVATAWFRRDRAMRHLSVLAALTTAAALIALARVTGIVAPYVVLWLRVVALLVWLPASWAAWSCLRPTISTRARRAVTAALATALVVSSAAATVAAARQEVPGVEAGAAVRALSIAVRGMIGPEAVVAIEAFDHAYLSIGGGLQLDLERHGYDAFEPKNPEGIAFLGEHRQIERADADRTFVVFSGTADVGRFEDDPAFEVLARWDGDEPAILGQWVE